MLGLPTVEEEIRLIARLGDFDKLFGAEANMEVVIPNLQEHPWVHFACHGHRHVDTFHSCFQLYSQERLQLLDIMKARLPNAELAFLSACHAAAVDQQALDVSVHLAAALQFCGADEADPMYQKPSIVICFAILGSRISEMRPLHGTWQHER